MQPVSNKPIDYSLEVQSPIQAALQGYGLGAKIGDDLRAQQDRQIALEQKKLMSADIAALNNNPNASARDFAALTLKYPQLKDQLKQSFEMVGSEQKAARLSLMTQAYAALSAGKPEIAEQLMRDRAAAMRNSGGDEKDIKSQEMWADMIKASPSQARNLGGLMLSSIMEPDKFAETFSKLGAEGRAAEKAPAELRQAEAGADKAKYDAETARITSKYGEQSALADLQKKNWDVKKIEADIGIAKEANRIAAMNAATNREQNALKKQELQMKVDEARMKLDEKVREKVGQAESGAATIDNALNTIERILKNKSLDSVLGSIEGNAYYPNATMGTMNPLGDGDERADAIALIETLGSQAFLSQVPSMRGMGSLTEREGAKLESALTNLSRKQSEAQFRENAGEARRILTKAREGLSKSTGVPLGKPDTPASPTSGRPPLDSFFKAN